MMPRLLLLILLGVCCACTSRETIHKELAPLSERLDTLDRKVADLEQTVGEPAKKTAGGVAGALKAGEEKAAGALKAGEERAAGALKKLFGREKTSEAAAAGGGEDATARAEKAAARAEEAATRAEAAAARAEEAARKTEGK